MKLTRNEHPLKEGKFKRTIVESSGKILLRLDESIFRSVSPKLQYVDILHACMNKLYDTTINIWKRPHPDYCKTNTDRGWQLGMWWCPVCIILYKYNHLLNIYHEYSMNDCSKELGEKHRDKYFTNWRL